MAKRTYSLDFKTSAAKLVTEQGRGPKDVATSLGFAPGTLRSWVRRFGTNAARPQAPDDHATLLELLGQRGDGELLRDAEEGANDDHLSTKALSARIQQR